MADALPDTPQLDELEKGKWPSFVKEIKMAAKKSPMSRDLLGQLEQSYRDKIGHWKHGGIVVRWLLLLVVLQSVLMSLRVRRRRDSSQR